MIVVYLKKICLFIKEIDFLCNKFKRRKNMEHNCAIINDKKAFRYRAAAIIVEGNCVLFAGNDVDDYYYSVGGAVHMGETSEEAVKREVLKRQVLITRSITLP